jgi:hypothetical protein
MLISINPLNIQNKSAMHACSERSHRDPVSRTLSLHLPNCASVSCGNMFCRNAGTRTLHVIAVSLCPSVLGPPRRAVTLVLQILSHVFFPLSFFATQHAQNARPLSCSGRRFGLYGLMSGCNCARNVMPVCQIQRSAYIHSFSLSFH